MIKIHRNLSNTENVANAHVEHKVQSVRVIEEAKPAVEKTVEQSPKEKAQGGKKSKKKGI